MRFSFFLFAALVLLGAGCSSRTELGDLVEDGFDPTIVDPNPLPPSTTGIASNQGLYGTWRLESYTRTAGSMDKTFAHYGRTLTISPSTVTNDAVNYVVADWQENYGTEVVQTGGANCTFSGTRNGTVDLLPRQAGDIEVTTLRFRLANASGTPKGTCEYPGGNSNGAAGQVEGTVASPSVNPNGLVQDYSFVLSGDLSTLTLSGTLAPSPLSATIVWKRVQ